MNPQLLLHQDGQWLAFDEDRVQLLDGRPRIDRSTVVLTDFDGAISDVTSLEGSTAHAVALIERRLRAEGLIDGDSKVLIHHSRTVGNGYQALYTAVPLDRWQPMFGWADDQPDHCLLVPTVALLWKLLKPGKGVVLHSGRKVAFLAALPNRVVFASALAYSDSRDDLMLTVAGLGDRAGQLLSADDEGLDALDVQWIAALTRLPEKTAAPATRTDPVLDRWPGDDETPTERTSAPSPTTVDASEAGMTFEGQQEYLEGLHGLPPSAVAGTADPASARRRTPAVSPGAPLDAELMERFAASSGASVSLAPHAPVVGPDGAAYRSGVLPLLRSASPGIAVNPPIARIAQSAERLLPWAAAASLALALGLGALGGRWTLAAHEAGQRADALQAEIESLDAQTEGLAARQSLPADYGDVLAFLDRATTLRDATDPAATLAAVRAAAADDVRVLRILLDTQDPAAPTLRVDGVVNYGSAAGDPEQGQQVARFVTRLREAGYVPEAIDPQIGNARSGAPGGLFSYLLKRPPTLPPAAGATP